MDSGTIVIAWFVGAAWEKADDEQFLKQSFP